MPPRDTRFKRMRRARGVAGDFDDDALELGDVIGDVIGDAVDPEPLYEAVEQLGEDDQEVAASYDKEYLDACEQTVWRLQSQTESLALTYDNANTRALIEVARRLRAEIETARGKPGFAREDTYKTEREELNRKIRAATEAFRTMAKSEGRLPAEQERAERLAAGDGDPHPTP